MSYQTFREMLEDRWAARSMVCVGLDSEYTRIPAHLHPVHDSGGARVGRTILKFNKEIVDATHDLVCAYKPNIAFYEMYGAEGLEALRDTVEYIHSIAPELPVILDAKRGDIGNTNEGYVHMAFDFLGVDAITVQPYLGGEALQPFLKADKGIIVLCRTSNPGAGEFQDLQVVLDPSMRFADEPATWPLYKVVAKRVAEQWDTNSNCAVVVGATYPQELAEVRQIVGDMPILIPGIGAQGGDLKATVAAGRDSRNQGMIINSARGIIFASKGEDFAEAARRETLALRNAINEHLAGETAAVT